MKCANNTICNFLGYVYYSDKIAKNLISGIKLAQSGINCEIKNTKFKPELIIKNNNKIIFNTQLNKHNNFKIKTINKNFKSNNILFINKEYNENIWHNRLDLYHLTGKIPINQNTELLMTLKKNIQL
ncbi:hypothetical protein BCR32DRAFT_283689 [Anaeromyces robustus]|uniref:Uncharacterized protein n=1 Tax=Anaeromyces robustus TaxID=1754192 RepID=A0A1Y1WTS0_9FUNG|nr:hypothetical protein BCR32DRAFT_283689 [Anaeromyces robustus]|eukprot:ORX76923.1 hypothetical protein BCR32DRAFT_283689 [Anaeromyces robustus]